VPRLGILDREAFALEVGERDLAAGQSELLEVVADRAEVGIAIGHGRDRTRFGLRAEPFQRFANVALARIGRDGGIDTQRFAPGQRTERLGLRLLVGRKQVFEHERVAGRNGFCHRPQIAPRLRA
jgi:hypothetical protein